MASGNTLSLFMPLGYEPPPSGMATVDTRNGRYVLDFDSNSDEYAIFSSILPKQYGNNGITAYIHYSMTSATGVNDVVGWRGEFERIGDNILSIENSDFASAKLGSGNVPTTLGRVDVVSISFSDGAEIDALQPGEYYRFRLSRDTANDTASGDAELLAIELREG